MKKAYFIIFLHFLVSDFSYAQGINSNTEGFYVLLSGQYSNWVSNSNFFADLAELEPNGVGMNLEVGYGVTSAIRLFGSYAQTAFNFNKEFETSRSVNYELGARYTFNGSLNAFRPYLSAGAIWQNMAFDPISYTNNNGQQVDNVKLSMGGYGFAGKLGANYYFTPEFALDLSLGLRIGSFSEVYIEGEYIEDYEEVLDFRNIFAGIGVSYSFF